MTSFRPDGSDPISSLLYDISFTEAQPLVRQTEELKEPEAEADLSHSCNPEVKNSWSFKCTCPARFYDGITGHGACYMLFLPHFKSQTELSESQDCDELDLAAICWTQ
jgi:hypothetical protein